MSWWNVKWKLICWYLYCLPVSEKMVHVDGVHVDGVHVHCPVTPWELLQGRQAGSPTKGRKIERSPTPRERILRRCECDCQSSLLPQYLCLVSGQSGHILVWFPRTSSATWSCQRCWGPFLVPQQFLEVSVTSYTLHIWRSSGLLCSTVVNFEGSCRLHSSHFITKSVLTSQGFHCWLDD